MGKVKCRGEDYVARAMNGVGPARCGNFNGGVYKYLNYFVRAVALRALYRIDVPY